MHAYDSHSSGDGPGRSTSSIDQALLHLYEATLRQDALTQVLQTSASLLGCARAVFLSIDHDRSVDSARASIGFDSAAVGVLIQRPAWLGGLCAVTRSLPANSVAVASELMGSICPESGHETFVRRNELDYAMVAILENSAACLCTISFFRSSGNFDATTKKTLVALLPHLRIATSLGRRLARLSSQCRELLAVFDLARQPVIMLDEGGCVLHANPAATRLLARDDGIAIRESRLTFTQHTTSSEFDRLVSSAINASGGPRDAIRAGRRDAGAFYELVVMPVAGNLRPALASSGARCMVLVNDPAAQHKLYAERLVRLYDLTAAEARVCEALFETGSIGEAARRLFVTRNTVQTHLKRIFRKVGVANQGQLMVRLSASARVM